MGAVQQTHERVAGWVNEDETRGFECSCGTVYDGLDRAGSIASDDPSADVSVVWQQHCRDSAAAVERFQRGLGRDRAADWLRLLGRGALTVAVTAAAAAVLTVIAGVATIDLLGLCGVLMVAGPLGWVVSWLLARVCVRRAHRVWDGRWSD